MKLDKNAIIPALEKNKAMKANDDVYSLIVDGVKCGIDFKKNEFFWMDDLTRMSDDSNCEELKKFKEICLGAMFSKNKSSGEPSKSAPSDATDQSASVEETDEEENTVDENVHEHNEPVGKLATQPIRGIKGIIPQLCECGKIKIGRKGKMTTSRKGTHFRPPEKLDHFIVTTMQKTKDDDLVEDTEVMQVLGDNCTEIPVMLLYDDPELNFVTSLAYYDSAACQCRGNGEIAVTADGKQITCDPEACPHATAGKCKPNGVLQVVLRDAPRVGGVWKFRTTGWNSIRNLMSSIEFIRDLTGGRLAGLPLMLTLQPKTTLIPGTKTTTTIYMVNMEYRGTMAELMNTAANRYISEEKMAQLEAKAAEKLALPESPEECKDVQEEFYPETVGVSA
jgi:hypothetical protein